MASSKTCDDDDFPSIGMQIRPGRAARFGSYPGLDWADSRERSLSSGSLFHRKIADAVAKNASQVDAPRTPPQADASTLDPFKHSTSGRPKRLDPPRLLPSKSRSREVGPSMRFVKQAHRLGDTIPWPKFVGEEPRFVPSAGEELGCSMLRPPVDIFCSESAYVLCMDLPGATKEDVSVEWGPGYVKISGLMRRVQNNRGILVNCERKVGTFERTVELKYGSSIDTTQSIDFFATKAKLENGVLIVTVPKTNSRGRQYIVKIQ
ncbi:HSP20-like chaperone [Xylaria sp. FL0064]|nr:HSP20-like chaperone [Xylaria sp. FL0064]